MNFKSFYSFLLCENLQTRLPFLLKKYPNETKESIEQISNSDPTKEKKFLDWILKLKQKNLLRFPEDSSKILQTLTKFVDMSKKGTWDGNKDINSYKSYADLVKTIENNSDITNSVDKDITGLEGLIFIKEHKTLKIYRITDAKTMTAMAEHTQWCVREMHYAEDYLKKGPFYYITKRDLDGTYVSYVLIHFETNQIKDTYDDAISSNIASEIYPLIKNSFKNFKFSYDDLGDFKVFLPIAEGKDKEILEEYNAPSRIYDLFHNKMRKEVDLTPKETEILSKSARYSFMYARNFLQKRFLPGEPAILKSTEYYQRDYGRFLFYNVYNLKEYYDTINDYTSLNHDASHVITDILPEILPGGSPEEFYRNIINCKNKEEVIRMLQPMKILHDKFTDLNKWFKDKMEILSDTHDWQQEKHIQDIYYTKLDKLKNTGHRLYKFYENYHKKRNF